MAKLCNTREKNHAKFDPFFATSPHCYKQKENCTRNEQLLVSQIKL